MEYDLCGQPSARYCCGIIQTKVQDEGADVVRGLSHRPKTLPSYYFYDRRGSELFEQICALPEYYPTGTEQGILADCAQEITALTGHCDLVELGSGSSRKTRILLDAYTQLQGAFTYIPIDVSTTMLRATAFDLLNEYPRLSIHALAGVYELALVALPPRDRSRLLIFLGSTIGNLSPQEQAIFLQQIHQSLAVGDYFLLGVDLQKDSEILNAAYNDRQGVTAAFNLNILQHLNERFNGNFRLEKFRHWAFYNQELHQIEMHLVSLEAQVVKLYDLDLELVLDDQETIRTEISRKFELGQIRAALAAAGLTVQRVWSDARQWFALILAQKVGETRP